MHCCLHAGPGTQQQTSQHPSSASPIQQSSLTPAAALHQWRPQASRQAQLSSSIHTASHSRHAALEASLAAEVQQCLHELALGADSSARLLCALCRRLQFSCQGRLQQHMDSRSAVGREDVAVVRVVGALVAASSACQRLVLQSMGALDDSADDINAAAETKMLRLRC